MIDCHSRTLALQWEVQWMQAFPTLCGQLLFGTDGPTLAWKAIEPRLVTKTSNDQADAALDWSESLGYGEITAEAIFEAFRWLADLDVYPRSVVDLGSGSGRVLLAASLCHEGDNLGLEIVTSWHEQALENQRRWKDMDLGVSSSSIVFRCTDFTAETSWIKHADFVIVHATVFGEQLMRTLDRLCIQCRPSTYFLMVTRELPSLTTVCEGQLTMTWGRGKVYLQCVLPKSLTQGVNGPRVGMESSENDT